MPIDYKKYPPNWKAEIVPRIKERANHKCEVCGVNNYAVGYRLEDGSFFMLCYFKTFKNAKKYKDTTSLSIKDKLIVIVLTVAHLDHDETNHDVKDDRLKAMCQRCHLRYDAPDKARRRKLNNIKNKNK